MKEKRVGLYLGVNSVGATVTQAKNVLSLVRYELSSVEEPGKEALSDELRWEALINKTLREVGADTKKIYVSLADREFIFRPLELPLMSRKELDSSLIYEIEKYIPFKMDELVWDYDSIRSMSEKKISLSFIGIRIKDFQRTKDILARLGYNPVMIEPSCLSLLRGIKALKASAGYKNFALLDFTQPEAYLTFFQNNLPVFNRYLSIPKKENALDTGAFVDSVNFSFQYFKREFKSYKLERLLIIGDDEAKSAIGPVEEVLQVKTSALTPYDLTNRSNAGVENAKALGVTSIGYSPYKYKPTLRKTEERFAGGPGFGGTALRIGWLSILAGIGLVGSIFLSIFLGNDIAEKKFILKQKEKDIFVPPELSGLSWEERQQQLFEKKSRLRQIKKMADSFTDFGTFFEKLGQRGVLPQRLWLEGLEVSQSRNIYSARLTGFIFRDDDYQERLGINEFISNLRKDQAISGLFSTISLDYSEREEKQEFWVTRFAIRLEQEK